MQGESASAVDLAVDHEDMNMMTSTDLFQYLTEELKFPSEDIAELQSKLNTESEFVWRG